MTNNDYEMKKAQNSVDETQKNDVVKLSAIISVDPYEAKRFGADSEFITNYTRRLISVQLQTDGLSRCNSGRKTLAL